MPTGYTAGILDGTTTTFQEFAKLCMRSFGATIHLRDEPLSKGYEPRVPSDYYSKRIKEMESEIIKIQSLSDKKIITAEKASLQKDKAYHLKAKEKTLANLKKLNEILREAKSFIPPTQEHEEFKKFMIEQLEGTINFDGNTKWHDEKLSEINNALKNLDAKKIRKERLLEAKRSLAYSIDENKKEIKRCKDSNKWVSDILSVIEKHKS